VQSTFDQIPDWGVQRFYTTPIWSRRLDRDPLPALTEPPLVTRVVWPANQAEWITQPDGAPAADFTLPSLDAFTHTLRTHYDVAFGLDASFRTMYLLPDAPDAGTLWYDLGHGACCYASFYLTPLIVNDRRLRPVGVLQTLHTTHCTPAQLERMLLHLVQWFLEHGCFAMSLYDLGLIPHELLQHLAFKPSDDRYVYAVRGPRRAIEPFTRVQPPFFIDFA
jgi:hypothetical protein